MVKKYCRWIFGMKKDAVLFGKEQVFCNLLKYFINTGNKFSYGIDEVFLGLRSEDLNAALLIIIMDM